MLQKTKELLTISNAKVRDYTMLKPVALYLETLVQKGDKDLDEKISKSEQDIQSCYHYIFEKAKEKANGANSIGIDSHTVFSWARHFYDELGNPADMPKTSEPKHISCDYANAKEEQEKRDKEVQRLSDLIVTSLKWEKDKKAKKFADAYLKICEEKDCQGNDDKYINWVTRSVVTSDCYGSVIEIDCNPDDEDIKSIIKNTLGEMTFSKKERREVMINDMPSLF